MSQTSVINLAIVAICMQTLAVHGLDPQKRDSLPPAIRERYRAQVRGVYRGETTGELRARCRAMDERWRRAGCRAMDERVGGAP